MSLGDRALRSRGSTAARGGVNWLLCSMLLLLLLLGWRLSLASVLPPVLLFGRATGCTWLWIISSITPAEP